MSLTLAAIGLLALSSWRSLATIQGLEQNEIAIERTCGRIVHLDEVLTMSARMAAATGDPAWEARYLEHVPLLDEAIERAHLLAPVGGSADSRQTDEANQALVAMELEAFDLLRAGRQADAAALLAGDAYERFKHVYSEGNARYLASMRARLSGILVAERARADREVLVLAVLLPLIVVLWVRVGRSIAEHDRDRRALLVRLRDDAAELQRMNEEVSRASRVKGDFLARMSHEIRTPMNGVLGIAQVLLKTELDDEQRRYVDTIVGSGNLLESILNDILDFSKIEAGMLTIVPVPSDPRSSVRDVAGTFEQRASAKGIELRARVSDDVPPALVLDPVRVRQILLNLVGNAVKFTERGHVELRLEWSGSPRETLVCTVTDTGEGIAPDRLDEVFKGFVQASDAVGRRHGGTGLGLTICSELSRAMGGSIEVSSEVGVGTTFTVAIPAPRAQAGAVVDEAARLPSGGTFEGRVLVAEDNPVNQLVARRMLESLGCRVDVAGNGRECVDRFRASTFDLVLMDLRMPVMDGLEATRALRALEGDGARTPVVALTASAFPGDAEACHDADMDGFLSKPVRENALRDALHRWLPSRAPGRASGDGAPRAA